MLNYTFIRQVGIIKWGTRYFVRQFRKRILKKGVRFRLPTGLHYDAPPWDPSGTEAYVTHADMDWGAEKLLADVLEKDGTFIDVGAHTGYYSLYMLPLVSAVYAFEPDRQSYAVLEQYLSDYPDLRIFRNAVSNETGTMDIEVKGEGFSYIKDTAAVRFSPEKEGCEQIDVVRLDDYLEVYPSAVTGIKIDVDGPDLDVLEGAVQTATRYEPVILIELNSEELDRLFGICSRINYEVCAFTREQPESKKVSFIKLSRELAEQVCVKMYFLVPASKRTFFDDYVSAG